MFDSAGPADVSAGRVRGSITPRIWTPPLRELTPATSYGFDFNWFCAEVIGEPNDPWQDWLSIHVGELLPDGRPRFRQVLILVARQNGKTSWARKLILFWMFVDRVPTILGTSTDRSYAKKTWLEVAQMAIDNPELAAELGPEPVRLTVSEEYLRNIHRSYYYFAASNRRAGRSLTLHRVLLDELREHQDFSAWNAATKASNAVRTAQIVAITNQGDAGAVVLDAMHAPALRYIETGQGDPRLGLFEYSAPLGADPTDLHALAMANPDLDNRTDAEVLLADGRRAKDAGGEELAGFRTEVMCQRVSLLDPAIDPERWKAGGVDAPVDLAEHRRRVALCVDVSLDGSHATLAAAAVLDDGLVHTEIVQAWEGYGCTKALRAELPGIVERVRPRVLGWFPNGPAAAVAADLADRGHRRGGWPPRRVKVAEIKAETAAVCMGLAEIVKAGELRHPRDPMQTAHIESCQRLHRGDAWVFVRKDAGPIDGGYATAGAVHLARTLPPAPAPVVVSSVR
jgi:hypothetical protein